MKICLDAGHYGKYNRSKVVPSYYESDMVWKLHNYLAEELESYGVTIVKTRADQAKDMGLVARGKASKGCDLFLSIHSNACDTESVDYPLVITMLDGKGDSLGKKIAAKIKELMNTRQNGQVKHKEGSVPGNEWYSVLYGADAVGVMGMIIEHSFHTNTKAATWLSSDSNLREMAKAEANIIAEHYGLVKQPQESAAKYRVQVCVYSNKADADAMVSKLKAAGFEAVIVSDGEEKTWEPAVGDVVKFTGNKQYSSSDSDNIRGTVAGIARITAIAPGKKHPYHLVRTGDSGPYGWVDSGTFTKT